MSQARLLIGVNVFWLALSLLGDGLNTIVLPHRLFALVDEAHQATVLGLITFVGLAAADEILLEVEPGRVTSFLARLRSHLTEGPVASAGASFLPDESSTAERLVALADRRLYEDKARAA